MPKKKPAKDEHAAQLQPGNNKNILCDSCEYGARALGHEAWACILDISLKKADKECFAHSSTEQYNFMYKKWRESTKSKSDLQTFLRKKTNYLTT